MDLKVNFGDKPPIRSSIQNGFPFASLGVVKLFGLSHALCYVLLDLESNSEHTITLSMMKLYAFALCSVSESKHHH